MSAFAILLLAVALVALGAWVLPAVWRLRGSHEVRCPGTGELARVRVGLRSAAMRRLRPGQRLRVSSCNFWPERAWCHQDCAEALGRRA